MFSIYDLGRENKYVGRGFVIQERLVLSLFYVNNTVLELFLVLPEKETDVKLKKVSGKSVDLR